MTSANDSWFTSLIPTINQVYFCHDMWSRTNSKTMFLSCLIIGSISKDSRTPWSLCFWAATNKAEETKFCNLNSKQRKKKIIQNSYGWLKKRLGGFHQFLPWSTMNVPTSLSLKKNLGIHVLDSPSVELVNLICFI